MQYFEPNFIDEALVLLDRFAPHARVLAGGSLLGFGVRARPSEATAIVNVKRIPALREISFDGATLTIGALVTAREASGHELIRAHAPLLALAASGLGARQLRTVATIGGNLCSRHNAADISTALLACDARCLLADIASGPTSVFAVDFVRAQSDPRTLLTAIEVPASDAVVDYQKMQTRRAFEMAVVGAAVAVELDGGTVRAARVALGGAAATPVRAAQAESWLRGKPAGAAAAREAARIAAERDADPPNDAHASAEYRRQLAGVLTERALHEIFDLAGGAR
ncbi:MAG TPA: FAD binding domain-containing protein [Candidatus Eremiobacteraceae bacterium]|nr:FAD binding domain-containing protein [Candidatus Eremiobacteraceae bacterium]